MQGGAQEVEVLHSVDEAVTQGDGWGRKSTTISTVFRALSSKLLSPQQFTRWSISHL